MNLDDLLKEDSDLNESSMLYAENKEHDVLINEQIMFESMSTEDILNMLDNPLLLGEAIDAGILNEDSEERLRGYSEINENFDFEELPLQEAIGNKMIIRLDKKARFERARMQAIFTLARRKNDKDFKKLVKIWKMRRIQISKLEKKYGTQGAALARKNMNNTKKIVKKVTKKKK